MQIDDPLGAGPMHGVCGAWGVLFVGLLAKEVRWPPKCPGDNPVR